jgi:hypothetical protein
MSCDTRKLNLIKPAGYISGIRPSCIAALLGFFIGSNNMKQIPLTQGNFALVDDDDYMELSKFNWCACRHGNNLYAYRSAKGKDIAMHRVVLLTKKPYIDHINHNGLDNRKQNLRGCTNAQNQMNTFLSRVNTSGFKGVYWNKAHERWVARIRYNAKQIHLGNFTCLIKAAKAYDKAARKYHGHFARTNFELKN